MIDTHGAASFIAACQTELDVSPPTNVATLLEHAMKIINDLVDERDHLAEQNRRLLLEKIVAGPKLPHIDLDNLVTPTLPSEIFAPAKPGGKPKIWWKNADEWSLDAVTRVVDRDGDRWKPADPTKPFEVWKSSNELTFETFQALINSYGPVADCSSGQPTGAWFDDGEEIGSPNVEWVRGGEEEQIVYTQINNGKWRPADGADEWVKENGYKSFTQVLEDEGGVFRVWEGPKYEKLKWRTGEPEPHESFTQVIDTDRYFWERRGPVWICPDGGEGHARRVFGKQEVTWDELLSHFGTLMERYT